MCVCDGCLVPDQPERENSRGERADERSSHLRHRRLHERGRHVPRRALGEPRAHPGGCPGRKGGAVLPGETINRYQAPCLATPSLNITIYISVCILMVSIKYSFILGQVG